MTAKQVLFGDTAHAKIVKGMNTLADAVRVTLGPKARTVMLEKSWGAPTVINSGVVVAKDSPGFFPVMKADLALYPLSSTETQIDLSGQYEPPMGPLGKALDAMVGHRIAEASVHRFVGAVADRLRQQMRR